MPAVTIRNISEETHQALKARAASHGRSTEAEIRAILEDAVHDAEGPGLGTALRQLGERFGGLELDIRRDPTPIKPATFK
jgi:Plasmid stability protein